ncbi:Hsp33 family molecular chaperone HslO [Deferrisoma camini]|uniref:Hsp33 family molecular chaperone HslO n=1 Tax=Deferrisoma camini TaxID=1035120 RepID=UPI00046CE9BB|nr:Hsp33 family molecular chaperone HslO [Deferrisoma camini]
MADRVVAVFPRGGGFLVRAAETTALAEEARRRHNLSPTATAALGRALTGAALLGSLGKGEASVLLQWRGDGPLGAVVAEGRADLAVRGYVQNPQADLPSRDGKLDVGGGVGKGELVVVRDLGLKEPYVSTAPIQTGEVAEDLAYYLLTSEQIPSAVALGVYVAPDYRVGAAGGVLVEALPDATDRDLDRLVENFSRLGGVTELLREGGLDAVLDRALAGLEYEVEELGTPEFRCRCNEERLDATLAALGPDEARRLLEEKGEIRVTCSFCGTEWIRRSLDGPWARASGRGGS